MRIIPTNTKALALGSLMLGIIVGAVLQGTLSPYLSLVEIVLMIGGLFIATVFPYLFDSEQAGGRAFFVIFGGTLFLGFLVYALEDYVRHFYSDGAGPIPPALEWLPKLLLFGGIILIGLCASRFPDFDRASKSWKELWYRLTTAGLSREKESALRGEVERDFLTKP